MIKATSAAWRTFLLYMAKLLIRRSYLSYLLIGLFLFLLIPGTFYQVPMKGLDPSYIIAVHLAYKYHLIFGKDIVFTFGPLGVLNYRFPIGVSRWVYLLFDIYFLGTTFFLLRHFFREGYGSVLFFALGFLLALYEPAFQWYFLFFLFYLFAFIREPGGKWTVLQPALLSVILFYYKVNLGLTAVILFIGVLHYLLLRRRVSWQRYVFILGGYVLFTVLLAGVLHVDLWGYVVGSWQLIDSYNDAMYLSSNEGKALLFAAVTVLALVGLRWVYLAVMVRPGKDELVIQAIGLFALFIFFKSGFVRMDNFHISHFFNIAGLIMAIIYFYSGRKRTWGVYWVVLGIIFVADNRIPQVRNVYQRIVNRYFIKAGEDKTQNYWQGFRDFEEARVVQDVGRRAAQDVGRPAGDSELKRIIGDASVDVIPSEISIVYFNGLRYNPRPVIQSYSAYDSYLDGLNYEKYMSPDAPDYILFSLESIDDRYAFGDEPRTRLAVLKRYTLVGQVGGNLLLRKKGGSAGNGNNGSDGIRESGAGDVEPASVAGAVGAVGPSGDVGTAGGMGGMGAVDSGKIWRLGEDIPVNNRSDLQHVRWVVHYTLWGRIRRWFFQPPPLKMTMTFDDSAQKTFRAAPPMLEDGLLLNKYVNTLLDFELLMRSGGQLGGSIRSIRFEADSTIGGFENSIKMMRTNYSFSSKEDTVEALKWVDQYTPFLQDRAAYIVDTFKCWIEDFQPNSPLVQVQGWAFRDKPDVTMKVVVRSGDTVYALPFEKRDRPDVAAWYKTNVPVDGFSAKVSKALLPPGDYQVGVLFYDSLHQKGWVRYVDSWIRR